MNKREILERIVTNKSCVGIACEDDDCPLYSAKWCVSAGTMASVIEVAKEMLTELDKEKHVDFATQADIYQYLLDGGSIQHDANGPNEYYYLLDGLITMHNGASSELINFIYPSRFKPYKEPKRIKQKFEIDICKDPGGGYCVHESCVASDDEVVAKTTVELDIEEGSGLD